MRALAAATAGAVTLLASAQVAPALEVGANDDTSKHMDDRGAALFAEMRALGLTRVVIGVRYTPSAAMTIADKPLLDEVVPRAVEAGLKVVLAVYPYPPREIEAGIGTPLLFGSYVKALARAYPQVREVIVGNEPNQPAFWRPQFDAQGRNVSAAAFGAYLAAAYDALKSVDSEIVVVGVGLSPRGNDKPSARNNVSTSPVRFLRALGAWYRASGRTRPLMDAFSFHPYPARATDPLERGYSWPNAGFVNLDRVKQALWDAFHGTAQRTPANGLKLHLDEVGWQVDTSTRSGYAGWENVPVTDELTQAAIYGELVRRAACDPGIASLSFFGFRDDGLRTGFQAGLQWVDGVPRAAAEAVRVALAETADGCKGTPVSWRPERRVQGARVDVRASPRRVRARIAAGEDARAVVCARPWRPGASRRCREVAVPGLRSVTVALPLPHAGRRGVAVEVELVAEANAARRVRVVERPRV